MYKEVAMWWTIFNTLLLFIAAISYFLIKTEFIITILLGSLALEAPLLGFFIAKRANLRKLSNLIIRDYERICQTKKSEVKKEIDHKPAQKKEIKVIQPEKISYKIDSTVERQRQVAKKICQEKGEFSVSELLQKLEEENITDESQRKEVMKEVNEWIKEDPFCHEIKNQNGAKYYSFA